MCTFSIGGTDEDAGYRDLLRFTPAENRSDGKGGKTHFTSRPPQRIKSANQRNYFSFSGAGYRGRTDDIQLGKLTLYQLS